MTNGTVIADPQYAFRLSLFSRLATYRLTDRSLVWTQGKPNCGIMAQTPQAI